MREGEMKVLLRVFKLRSSSENVEIINRIDKMGSFPLLLQNKEKRIRLKLIKKGEKK